MKLSKFVSFIILFVIFGLTYSCTSIKEVPIQTVETIVYKDSLVYIHDSVRIDVPHETIREILPQIDTSFLKTSLAESIAYLDTTEKKIFHSLTQKGEIKIAYDTIVSIKYIDKIITQDVPVTVEVIKYKRDSLFWALLGWAIFCICLVGLKIFVFK